jgi:hypothetical protein
VKFVYIIGILLALLAFEGPRKLIFHLVDPAHGGAKLEPGRMVQPVRKHPRDLTVPKYFRGYNGPRDA